MPEYEKMKKLLIWNRIVRMLKENGFRKMEAGSYANDRCNIHIEEFREVRAANNMGDVKILKLDFYAVFGYLTYHKIII
jgi:hypothetical protein